MPKPYINQEYITTSSFIRLLAQESGFTLTDSKIFLKAFIRVFARVILSGKVLHIVGFGTMYVKEIQCSDKGWNGLQQKYYERKPSRRINFSISSVFKKLLKEEFQNSDQMDSAIDQVTDKEFSKENNGEN